MAGRDHNHYARFRDSSNHHASSISTTIEDSRHPRTGEAPRSPPSTSRAHHHHQPPPQPSRDPSEDRVVAYLREIQALHTENQRLIATYLALKQELSLTVKDLQQLAGAAEQVKTAKDAEVRAVLAKTVKIEAEYRTVEGLMAGVVEVRKEVKRLEGVKGELGDRLKGVSGELEGLKPELEELAGVRTEMESLSQDLQKGRAAIETERKTSISNNEHGRVMERNISALRHEIDKLQAELANAHQKAAAANPGGAAYHIPVATYGNSNSVYGQADTYPNHYGVAQVHGGESGNHHTVAHNGQSSAAIVTNGPLYGAAQVHHTNGPV